MTTRTVPIPPQGCRDRQFTQPAPEFIGLTVDQATKRARSQHQDFSVTCINGKPAYRTLELGLREVEVTVTAGHVATAWSRR